MRAATLSATTPIPHQSEGRSRLSSHRFLKAASVSPRDIVYHSEGHQSRVVYAAFLIYKKSDCVSNQSLLTKESE